MIVVYWVVGVLLVYYLFQAEIILLKSSNLVENKDAIKNLHKKQEKRGDGDLYKENMIGKKKSNVVLYEEDMISEKKDTVIKSDVDLYE